jgi:hypothetical protein
VFVSEAQNVCWSLNGGCRVTVFAPMTENLCATEVKDRTAPGYCDADEQRRKHFKTDDARREDGNGDDDRTVNLQLWDDDLTDEGLVVVSLPF